MAKRIAKASLAANAVVGKLKYHDFRGITRYRMLPYLPTSGDDLRW